MLVREEARCMPGQRDTAGRLLHALCAAVICYNSALTPAGWLAGRNWNWVGIS